MKTSDMFDLTERTALVTGGSRGIGLEIARGLGELNAKVVIAARTQEELSRAEADLRAQGHDATAVVLDLAELGEIDQFVEGVVRDHGDIDILVNNAGVSFVSNAETHPVADWLRVMDVNLNAPFFLSQAIADRCMIPRSAGKIINVSSIGGLGGTAIDTPYISSYSASKGGIIALTRALATEWGRFNINVNVVAPGNFPSAMTAHTLPSEHHERVLAKTPLGRVGGDDDMKGVIAFLASEASRHVTGQLLVVDGGAFTTNYSAIR